MKRQQYFGGLAGAIALALAGALFFGAGPPATASVSGSDTVQDYGDYSLDVFQNPLLVETAYHTLVPGLQDAKLAVAAGDCGESSCGSTCGSGSSCSVTECGLTCGSGSSCGQTNCGLTCNAGGSCEGSTICGQTGSCGSGNTICGTTNYNDPKPKPIPKPMPIPDPPSVCPYPPLTWATHPQVP